jgi:phosphoglycolate phosphatase-like HAD superfamily hydrolase
VGNTLVIFPFEEALFLEQGRIGFEAVAGAMRYFGIPQLSRRAVEAMRGLPALEVASRCLCTQNEAVLASFAAKLMELAAEASAAQRGIRPGCAQMLRILHDAGAVLCVYTERSGDALNAAFGKAGLPYVRVMPHLGDPVRTLGAILNLLPHERSILVADGRNTVEAGRQAGCILIQPSGGKRNNSGVFDASPNTEAVIAAVLKEMEQSTILPF